MNKWQREHRGISDREMDDTSVEQDASEGVSELADMIKLAMADGKVTMAEMLPIRAQTMVVAGFCDKSLQNNITIQQELDSFTKKLGAIDADARALHPELGTVTIGELISGDDWYQPEAA